MEEFAIVRVVAALLLILGLILACGFIAKRLGIAGSQGKNARMRVSSRIPLGPKSHVIVLDTEDSRLILGVTSSSINVLQTLPPVPNELGPANAGAMPPKQNFAQLLNSALGRGSQA